MGIERLDTLAHGDGLIPVGKEGPGTGDLPILRQCAHYHDLLLIGQGQQAVVLQQDDAFLRHRAGQRLVLLTEN